jgi:uncharacterized protein
MTRFAIQRVRATPAALELLASVAQINGPLAFFQSVASEEEASLTCLTRGEALPSDRDVKLGAIAGAPVYVDVESYERCGRPAVVVDVAPGSAGVCSLPGLEHAHFVTRAVEAAERADVALSA